MITKIVAGATAILVLIGLGVVAVVGSVVLSIYAIPGAILDGLKQLVAPTIDGTAYRQACYTIDASTEVVIPVVPLGSQMLPAIKQAAGDSNRANVLLRAIWWDKTKFGTVANAAGEFSELGNDSATFFNGLYTPEQLADPAFAVQIRKTALDKAQEGLDPKLWAGDPTFIIGIILGRVYNLPGDLDKGRTIDAYQHAAEQMRQEGYSMDFEHDSQSWINTTVPQTILPETTDPEVRKQQIYTFFVQKGMTPWQAAGIMGNMSQESGYDPTAIERGGAGAGHGLVQWSFGRWKSNATRSNTDPPDADPSNEDTLWGYAQQMGRDWKELGLQLDFIWHEISEGNEKATLQAMHDLERYPATSTPEAAATTWSQKYERASVSQSNDPNRRGEAAAMYQKFKDLDVKSNAETCKAANIAVANRSTGNVGEDEQKAVNAAVSQQGVDYSWGGGDINGPGLGIAEGCTAACIKYGDQNHIGWDCSGLMEYAVYQATGVDIPGTTSELWDTFDGTQWEISKEALTPSDLILYNGHVAMYVGNGMMVEAPQSGKKVRVVPMKDGLTYIDIIPYAEAQAPPR